MFEVKFEKKMGGFFPKSFSDELRGVPEWRSNVETQTDNFDPDS
jgi:hypothetical protein